MEEKVDHQQLEDTIAPVKDFAAVSRVDWRPKCSRILDGVNSQYFWPQHFIFSFCSIPLKICHRLRGLWGQGTDRSSAPSRFAPLFFYYRDYCPPERTGQYPSQGTPLGSSWNLEFLNLT